MIKFAHTSKLDFMRCLYCFYSYTLMYLLAFTKYMINQLRKSAKFKKSLKCQNVARDKITKAAFVGIDWSYYQNEMNEWCFRTPLCI